MDKDQRLQLLQPCKFIQKEINDIEAAVAIFPRFEAKIEAKVEGFDEILVNDLVTIKISVTRANLLDTQEVGYPHSNTNLEIYEEKAAVLVIIDDRIEYQNMVSLY